MTFAPGKSCTMRWTFGRLVVDLANKLYLVNSIRFISIQSLSDGRPALRKFSDRRSSFEDGPSRLAILQPLSFPFATLFYFQSWSRAPCVMNPGGRTNSDRDRRRLFSISLINHKHSPLTFNGLLIQLLSIKYNLIAVPHLAAKSRRRLPGPESSLCSAVNQTINRVGRPVSRRRLPQPN